MYEGWFILFTHSMEGDFTPLLSLSLSNMVSELGLGSLPLSLPRLRMDFLDSVIFSTSSSDLP